MCSTRCPGSQFLSSELSVPGLYQLPEAPSRDAQNITARFSWMMLAGALRAAAPNGSWRTRVTQSEPAAVPRTKKDPEFTGTTAPSSGLLTR
eukprot:3107726-Prymnesium_polylepis.3